MSTNLDGRRRDASADALRLRSFPLAWFTLCGAIACGNGESKEGSSSDSNVSPTKVNPGDAEISPGAPNDDETSDPTDTDVSPGSLEGPLPDPGFSFECGSRSTEGARVIEDGLEEGTTWEGLIYVPGDVYFADSAHLEIKAGTRVIMGPGARLRFRGESTVSARGTPSEPIVFCGETEGAGSWQGIGVSSSLEDSGSELPRFAVFENVLIADAGQDGDSSLTIVNQALLRGVHIAGGESYGLEIGQFAEGSTRLVISNVRAPIRLTNQLGLEFLPADLEIRDCSTDAADLGFASVGSRFVLKKLPVTYTLTTHLEGSLRLEAGVRVNASLLDLTANIIAQGTPEEPVVLGCWLLDEECDYFLNIEAGSELHHVQAPTAQVSVEAADTLLDHVTFERLALMCDPQSEPDARGLHPDTNHLEVLWNLNLSSDTCWYTLPRDLKLINTKTIDLGFERVGGRGTIGPQSVPFRFLAGVVFHSADVTLEPGVEIQFGSTGFAHVGNGSKLYAEGTPEAPIRLVDLGPSHTCSNNWEGLRIDSGTEEVVLRHVEILRAGDINDAVVRTEIPITLENATLNGCGTGVVHAADDPTDYVATNTIDVVGELSRARDP